MRPHHAAFLLPALASLAAADTLDIGVVMAKGRGDAAMTVVWLATDKDEYVRTLNIYSRDRKHYGELTGWTRARPANEKLDAVMGATIRWGGSATISVPVARDGRNLLDGRHVLCFETRKDKGEHYRSIRIPLTPGFAGATLGDQGYLKSITVLPR